MIFECDLLHEKDGSGLSARYLDTSSFCRFRFIGLVFNQTKVNRSEYIQEHRITQCKN